MVRMRATRCHLEEDVKAGDAGAVGGAVGAEGFFVAEDLVGDEGEAYGKLRER